MKMVAELEGAELDYWVARAEGQNVELCFADNGTPSYVREPKPGGRWFNFSTKWEECGPIIEREHIWLAEAVSGEWRATMKPHFWDRASEGQTPLIAAMRCFVASKFGDEVES